MAHRPRDATAQPGAADERSPASGPARRRRIAPTVCTRSALGPRPTSSASAHPRADGGDADPSHAVVAGGHPAGERRVVDRGDDRPLLRAVGRRAACAASASSAAATMTVRSTARRMASRVHHSSGSMNATAALSPASRRKVAIRRPGWTAGLIALRRSPSCAARASRSETITTRPQKRAGPGGASRASTSFEDAGPEAAKALAKVAGLHVADAAQRHAGRLEGRAGALEVGGEHDDVVEPDRAVGVGQAGAGDGRDGARRERRWTARRGRRERRVRSASSRRSPRPARPVARSRPRAPPRRRLRANPRAAQRCGASATASAASCGPELTISRAIRDHARASSRARANTASSIGSVRRPVNVFCWLTW